MINVYSHAKLETLASLLAFQIKQTPLDNFFEKETICITNPIVQRWLSVKLAQQNTIEANNDYPLAANLIWKLLKRVGLDCPDVDPLALDALAWKVIYILPSLIDQPDFSVVKHYLKNDYDGVKQWQLAKKIADVFDHYQDLCPESLLTDDNQMEPWLNTLWQKIVEDTPNYKLKLIFQFIEKVQAGGINPKLLPKRIHIFAPSLLPSIVFQFFEKMALITEVNFYVVSPTNHYWGDLTLLKKMAKARLSGNEQASYAEVGNSLLSSWGKVGQIFHDQLIMSDQVNFIAEDVPFSPANTLLQTIQNDVFDLYDARLNQPLKVQNDGSIKVNACHSKMRECQILHDEMLNLFNHASSNAITPEDILALTPNIVDYAPYIEAVFNPSKNKPYIPWNINDVPIADIAPLYDVFLQLFDLAASRFKQSEILIFLDLKEVQHRFDLSADDVIKIKNWVKQNAIHWGKSAQHKKQLGLPSIELNTWRFGLDRMMASYALGSNECFNDFVTVSKIDSTDAETLGKFNQLYEALVHYSQRIAEDKTPTQWQQLINEMLDQLFTEDLNASAKQTIRDSVEQWLSIMTGLAFDTPISALLVKKVLQEKLQMAAKKIAFMTGGVTFSSMKPFRNIPFKVVFMMGLNEQDFPRKEVKPEFDTLSNSNGVGDLSIAEEDRYLFLETLMSAREKLIFSYVAFSYKDNSPKQPSLLLSELLEYIDERFILENNKKPSTQVVEKHRLQPYSAYYYDETAPKSYDRFWLKMLKQDQNEEKIKTKQWKDWAYLTVEDEPKDLQLDNILYFYKNPSARFVRQNAKVAFNEDNEETDDNEPLALDNLEQYQIKQQITQAVIEQNDIDEVKLRLFRKGALPLSKIGNKSFNVVLAKLQAMLPKLQGVDATDTFSLSFSENISHSKKSVLNLTGQIENLYPNHGIFYIRPGTAKGADYLTLWIQFLILQLVADSHDALAGKATDAFILSDKKFETFSADQMDVETARVHLESLVAIYQKSLVKPIALFNLSSYETALQLNRGKALADVNKASKWYNSYQYKGDEDNDYIQFLLRDVDEQPTNSDEFIKMVELVYLPMLKCLKKL